MQIVLVLNDRIGRLQDTLIGHRYDIAIKVMRRSIKSDIYSKLVRSFGNL